jgi:hypothetical protein
LAGQIDGLAATAMVMAMAMALLQVRCAVLNGMDMLNFT